MPHKHIVLVTGGQRSGKSGYAQKLALSLSTNPVYLATSRVWDEEFRQRVLRHQADRGPEWTNIEEEKYLSHHNLNGRVVVIDCVTLWGTNFFFDNDSNVEKSLTRSGSTQIHGSARVAEPTYSLPNRRSRTDGKRNTHENKRITK